MQRQRPTPAVNVHVFATDYDGTIAERNQVPETTARALERVRATGRKVLLVTGRMLPDLQRVCPEADRMFDAVVAENGALVYFPERREVRRLGDTPEPALIDALRRRGVRLDVGNSILATDAPVAEAALAAIRETGVERTLVFNKDALMLLPRHHLVLGERADGTPVSVAAHGTRLLVVGPSATGKSTLTGVLAERLLESGRSLVLLDTEGDYRTLADLERVVVFGGKGEQP